MRREFHVRFCEGGGVRFPSATRLVILFTSESDARRTMEVLPKRFAKYGLTLHPEKTKLIQFHRPNHPPRSRAEGARPGTFDLLGFTHYWALTRKGTWAVQRQTMRKRLARGLRGIAEWCRRHLHLKVSKQHSALSAKLRGHYQYYGITGNSRALGVFYRQVTRLWQRWLQRRNRENSMPWSRFAALLKHYPLPLPRVVHSALRPAANPIP